MKWDIQQYSQIKVNKRDLDLYQAGNKDTSFRVRDKQLVSWLYVTRWLTVNGQHKQTMSNILSLSLCGDFCDVRCPSSSVRPRVATYPYLHIPDISSVGPCVADAPLHITIVSHLEYVLRCLNFKTCLPILISKTLVEQFY